MDLVAQDAPRVIAVFDQDGTIFSLDPLTRKKKNTFFVNGDHDAIRKNRVKKYFSAKACAAYSRRFTWTRPTASDNIHRIQELGAIPLAMTKRFGATEDTKQGRRIRAETKLKLQNKNIPFVNALQIAPDLADFKDTFVDEIVYVKGNKVEQCLELAKYGKVIVWEDNPDNIYALAEAGIQVIVHPAPNNWHVEHDGNLIIRPDEWIKEAFVVEDPDTISLLIESGNKVIVYPTEENKHFKSDGHLIIRPDKWFDTEEELTYWDISYLIAIELIERHNLTHQRQAAHRLALKPSFIRPDDQIN